MTPAVVKPQIAKPAGEQPERPLPREPRQDGAESKPRAPMGGGAHGTAGRLARPDQEMDRDRGGDDGRRGDPQARPPAERPDQHREERHQRELPRGAARRRDPGGEAETAVEMGRDRGGDQRGRDRGEARAADDPVEQHELPGLRHRRREDEGDRRERHAERVDEPGAVPVEHHAGERRDHGHRGQHDRAGGRDQAVAPAQIVLEERHQQAERIARGDHDAEHQEQRADDDPALAGRARLDVGCVSCGQGTPVPGNPPDGRAIIEGPR